MGSASVTSAAVRRSHPRRCSTWRRCPSPSSRPRSCRWRPLGTPASRCSTWMLRSSNGCPSSRWPTVGQGRSRPGGLLSHSSGLPDVADYGWHDPQLGDDALSEFARSLSGWRLKAEPGSAFSYSNAGYELLGLLLSRVTGTTFEDAVRQQVLTPLGMRDSTFLRGEVPAAPGCLTARGRCRCRCPRAPIPTPGAMPPARPCTPTWSRCVAGWWPTSSRPRWLLGLRRAVGTAGRRAARPDVAAGGAGG